jgi:hypothetical protein
VLSRPCILGSKSSDVEIGTSEEGISLAIGYAICLLSVAAIGYECWLSFGKFSLVV